MFVKACAAAALSAAAIGATTGTATAQVPRFDARAYCDRVGNMAGGSYMIIQACLDQEREAYANISDRLPRTERRILDYCEKIGRTVGGSYVLMDACIDQEETSKASIGRGKKAPF